MDKNTRPESVKRDNLQVRERFVAVLGEMMNLHDEMHRISGQIEQQFKVYENDLTRLNAQLKTNRQSAARTKQRMKTATAEAGELLSSLFAVT